MSDTNEPLGPREQRLVTEISALPDVPAREDFRARLRAQFVAGEIPETSSEAPAADGDGKVIPFAVRVAFPLALAAVLAGLFVVLNRGPAWHALDPTSVARLRVGDQVYAASDPALPDVLRGGVHVQVEGEEPFDLASAGTLVMQITPGTGLLLPDPPARWWNRSSKCTIEDGEVRIVTGPRFAGARLHVDSPVAMVDVTGTTLAVICTPTSTCVCVFEGEVAIMERRDLEQVYHVPGGMRRTMHETEETYTGPILDMESQKLGMLRDAMLPKLIDE